jgi:hypothetical protein
MLFSIGRMHDDRDARYVLLPDSHEIRDGPRSGKECVSLHSALDGHIDYVDLAERVCQGIVVDCKGSRSVVARPRLNSTETI